MLVYEGGNMQIRSLAIGLLSGLIVGLLVFLLCRALSSAPKANRDRQALLPRYEYKLEKAVEVAGRQGITTDGRFYWVSGSTVLFKYDNNWKLIARNDRPFEGYKIEVNHIGDIAVYNNEIYAGVEFFSDGVGRNIQMAVYDGDTLKLKRTFVVQPDSGQLECSGIAVNPDEKKLIMCSWVGEESGRYLYEYDLETGAYLRKIHLQCPPQWLQGIAYYKGEYYLSADDGTADEGEADHIYRIKIDPKAGHAAVVLEKTLDDVKFQGEIEGLNFNPETGQLLVLYNRGSRIVLGMVKGFYPGYDREISEVFIYNSK